MNWDCSKCSPLNDRRDPNDVHVHIVTEQAYRNRPHICCSPTPAGWITAEEAVEILNNPAKYDGKEFVIMAE
jgi:hypothetical protein